MAFNQLYSSNSLFFKNTLVTNLCKMPKNMKNKCKINNEIKLTYLNTIINYH